MMIAESHEEMIATNSAEIATGSHCEWSGAISLSFIP